jgi:hypothetical protein
MRALSGVYKVGPHHQGLELGESPYVNIYFYIHHVPDSNSTLIWMRVCRVWPRFQICRHAGHSRGRYLVIRFLDTGGVFTATA